MSEPLKEILPRMDCDCAGEWDREGSAPPPCYRCQALTALAKRPPVLSEVIEQCAMIAENPYSDAVEAYGPDEPLAVGAKIAKAIRALLSTAPAEDAK